MSLDKIDIKEEKYTYINDIKPYFDKIISHNTGCLELNSNPILDQWFKAKEKFIRNFGGNLIVESANPITFHVNQKKKRSIFEDFIFKISLNYMNPELAGFLEGQGVDAFFSNTVVTADYGRGIPAGMKLSKAFKFFENDEFMLRKMQDAASRCMQQDKVTGTLCLSVHPLDFLSSSENDYNWRSCHALDGDFRAGNLSYMVDKTTIICYLKGKEEAKLPRFPEDVLWNSKKWRMLLTVSEDRNAMFAGRQYPFFAETALKEVSNLLASLPIHFYDYWSWSKWDNKYIDTFTDNNGLTFDLNQKYIRLFDDLVGLKDCIKNGSELHYNDLLYSTCYTPYYSFWYEGKFSYNKPIEVGGLPMCPICGEQHMDIPEGLGCSDCVETIEEEIYYCEICGNSYPGDEIYYVDGCWVCLDCSVNELPQCSKCGNAFFPENGHKLDNGEVVCDDCYYVGTINF